jgi:hypothetical protein
MRVCVCVCVVLSFLERRSHLLKWKNTTTHSIKATSKDNFKSRSSHCVPLCAGGWDYIIHTPPTCPRDLVVQCLGALIPLDGSVSCSRCPDTGSCRLTVVTDKVLCSCVSVFLCLLVVPLCPRKCMYLRGPLQIKRVVILSSVHDRLVDLYGFVSFSRAVLKCNVYLGSIEALLML